MKPFLTDYDFHLLGEGSHNRIYDKLGAHVIEQNGVRGTHFAVWAPNAREVSVIGDFNGWTAGAFFLNGSNAGVWTGFIPNIQEGALYKYAIASQYHDYRIEKADPCGFAAEIRPRTASKVWDLSRYRWNDADWMARRKKANALDAPIAIYEVHLGSWRRTLTPDPSPGGRGEIWGWLSYRELAPILADYVKQMGYTHVEFMPITEHPFDGSWGYQTVGYYAPTSRFGSPDDFRFLVDALHQAGVGVILDWVPAHFPRDGHGLAYFDGTHLYEHEDPRKGAHTEWGTAIFNYGRNEVSNFLISNALFWLDQYHIDGLRVDAVASMIYLDYARKEGEWIPNQYGGRENLEAVAFLRRLNERVYGTFPDVVMMAEESTAWPMVSRPTYLGGLGFGLKWDMGWMHDTLKYMSLDPVHRKYHHDQLTFRSLYAFTENFVLPLSHDEVVYGKQALLSKMPGDMWQQFANLRLLYGLMYAQPGKKLLFMGGEIGQWNEWNHEASIEWHLLDYPLHAGVQRWVRDLNSVYRTEAALHQRDCDPSGFEWIDCSDYEQGVLSFLREGKIANDYVLMAFNFTPVPRYDYHLGAPWGGVWRELLNSDAPIYGGAGQGNLGVTHAAAIPWHGRSHLLNVTLPPLAMVMFKPGFSGG
jgi:1,4-alpha-glucan branching enzyme